MATSAFREEQVVVLAGGLATRLGPLARSVPKVLQPVGDQVLHVWENLEAGWAEHLHHGELPASLRAARLHHKPGAVVVVSGALAGMAHDEAHA